MKDNMEPNPIAENPRGIDRFNAFLSVAQGAALIAIAAAAHRSVWRFCFSRRSIRGN